MISCVIECVDLDAEVEFFTRQLGARIHLVRPADDPQCVVVDCAMSRFEIRRALIDRPIIFAMSESSEADGAGRVLLSPGGSRVEMVTEIRSGDSPNVSANVPTLTVVEGRGDAFGIGRAGMGYRDLLPDRWGGRFIASHIRIDAGGDVADWVHFHRIRFQMIFVAAGWVDVVYEDQGEPFRMVAGDCVLQPPEIRHRVLRSSSGLEVIEIGCPAEHDTIADHDLPLPTSALRPERDFGGQRFVRHIAAHSSVTPWLDPSLSVRDTGIGTATRGLAGAVVISSDCENSDPVALTHEGEFAMIVGLAGDARLAVDGRELIELSARTSVALPAGTRWSWVDPSIDHEALVVTLPADAIRLA
jgi:quercetin dioxygenase-like cupin family protein